MTDQTQAQRNKIDEISSILNYSACHPGPIGNNAMLLRHAESLLKPMTGEPSAPKV